MIIGKGMLAQKFSNYKNDDVVVFASGVSNSNETDKKNFDREKSLLEETIYKYKDKLFVYFSSCDVDNPQLNTKAYYQHKLEMEQLIINKAEKYNIFRLPQVVGVGGNKNTLINFLIEKIKNHDEFELWEGTQKNIIDIDDVHYICTYVIENTKFLNSICNVVNTEYISISKLVKIIEKQLDEKAIYETKNFNASYFYNKECMENILEEIGPIFEKNYFETLISKHLSVTL
ncbi:NAD-dependent epimerase/dehydratase family protein [Sulfurimonas sp.]